MADELDPVTQRFIAEVSDYVEKVRLAAEEATSFADHVERVNIALNGMTEKLTTAAVALGITRDEMGRLRDKEGEVITATEAEARALKHLRDQALEAAWAMRELDKYQEKQRGSLLSRIGSGIAGGIGAIGSGIGSGLDAIGKYLPMILGIEAAALVLGPLVGALATGFLAAGAGVAAFGAVAIPNLTAASTAANQVQAAQDAYGASVIKIQGQYKYAMSLATTQAQQRKAHATEQLALNNALLTQQHAINMAYAELSPQQVQLSQAMGQLKNQWQSFVQANTGAVSSVLTKGIGIIGQLLPWLQQFVNVATPVIGQMLTGLSKFIESPNFQYFMTFLSQLSGPALLAIGSGMEGLVIRVMQLFETFSKKDVINAINIAFRLLGATIELVQGIILEGMAAWDLLTQTILPGVAHAFDVTRHAIASFAHGVATDFDGLRHNTAEYAHDVAHWFDDVRHGLAELAHDWAVWFDRIRHTIADWSDNVVRFFQQLPGRIVHALGNLLNLLVQAGKDIIQGLWNGARSIATGLLNWISNLASTISGTFTSFLGIRSPSRVFMQHGRDTLLGYIAGLQAVAPQVQAAMRAIGGQVAYGGLPGVTSGGYGASIGRPGLNVTVTVAPGAGSLADARWLQALQPVIQEAILRYNTQNPNNGLAIPGGRL